MAGKDTDARSKLEERLGPGILKDRLDGLAGETGGLLDEEAMLALLSDELGLTEAQFSKLAELDPARPVFTRCQIEAVGPARDFQCRERAGRLRKLQISDSSGASTLTLWDEETALVEQLGLRPGSIIRILFATLRETRFGREIHVGKTGFIIAEDAPPDDGPSTPRDIIEIGKTPGRVDVKGVILYAETRGRGSQKSTGIRLFDGTGEINVAIPHEKLAPPPAIGQGVEISVLSARVDWENGRPALICDGRSRLNIN